MPNQTTNDLSELVLLGSMQPKEFIRFAGEEAPARNECFSRFIGRVSVQCSIGILSLKNLAALPL
jgi:hypothetical protein